MSDYTGIYTFARSFSAPGAVTLLQLVMDSTQMCEVIRAEVTQYQAAAPPASVQIAAKLCRKSAAATVTTAAATDFGKNSPAVPTPTSTAPFTWGTAATGYLATAEGTDTDTLYQNGWNHLNGWYYVPSEDERDLVPPSGIIAVKLLFAAPASTTYYALLRVGVIG